MIMEWIPVTEKAPPPLTDVLVAYRHPCGKVIVDAGYMRHDRRFVYIGMEQVIIPGVVSWMELPAPPTEAAA